MIEWSFVVAWLRKVFRVTSVSTPTLDNKIPRRIILIFISEIKNHNLLSKWKET